MRFLEIAIEVRPSLYLLRFSCVRRLTSIHFSLLFFRLISSTLHLCNLSSLPRFARLFHHLHTTFSTHIGYFIIPARVFRVFLFPPRSFHLLRFVSVAMLVKKKQESHCPTILEQEFFSEIRFGHENAFEGVLIYFCLSGN